MKTLLFFVAVCASLAVISGEECKTKSECKITTCDSTSSIDCAHGECTCVTAPVQGSCFQATCAAKAECNTCQCRFSGEEHHCVDGHCMCGRRPGFPGIGK